MTHAPSWPLWLAACVYLLTMSLGVSVQYGHVRLGRWRWLHHGAFAATWAAALLALGLGWWWHARWWWRALLGLPVLALFPRRRASTLAHRWLGLAGLIVWALVLGTLNW